LKKIGNWDDKLLERAFSRFAKNIMDGKSFVKLSEMLLLMFLPLTVNVCFSLSLRPGCVSIIFLVANDMQLFFLCVDRQQNG
jgi:hypothetical protein